MVQHHLVETPEGIKAGIKFIKDIEDNHKTHFDVIDHTQVAIGRVRERCVSPVDRILCPRRHNRRTMIQFPNTGGFLHQTPACTKLQASPKKTQSSGRAADDNNPSSVARRRVVIDDKAALGWAKEVWGNAVGLTADQGTQAPDV